MKTLYYIIIFVVVLSCGNRQVNSTKQAEIDSVKPMKRYEDFVDALRLSKQPQEQSYFNQQTYESLNEVSDNDNVYDSIDLHNIDSLKRYVRFLKYNKNISVLQRIQRLSNLFNNSISTCNNLWDVYYDKLQINIDSLFEVEIGLLFKDKTFVNYNTDSLLSSIGKDLDICHSKDNRLFVMSWLSSCGGTGNCPLNLFIWRDVNGKFQNLEFTGDCFVYYTEIHKLSNSDKDLYLLFGDSKGVYRGVKIIELTRKGINLNYKGFKTKTGFYSSYAIPIEYDYENDSMYNINSFDSIKQIIKFRGNTTGWYDNRFDSLSIGSLTFNGKYFIEKLKMQKIKK